MPIGKSRNIKIVDGVQYNQCTKCEEWFKATTEYFYMRRSSKRLYVKCKKCEAAITKQRYYSKRSENTNQLNRIKQETKIVDSVNYQKCGKCEEWFPATRKYFYYISKSNKQKLFSMCIQCTLQYGKKYRQKNKEKLYGAKRAYREKNKSDITIKNRQWRCENKNWITKHSKMYSHSFALFATFAWQLTVDESPKKDKDGYLLVKCTYCGKYFKPIQFTVSHRIQSLNGLAGGEGRLYCSQGCKDACPIFNQKTWPKGFKPATSREVDPLIRQMCLARDDYICQKCEKTIDEIELHCHHIEGATQMPLLANDVENTITLCKPCHMWVHQQDGCGYNDLKCKNE